MKENQWKTNENQWETSKKWGKWRKTNEKTMKTNGKQGNSEENEGQPIGNKEKKGKWRKTNGKWKEHLSKPKKKIKKKKSKKNPSPFNNKGMGLYLSISGSTIVEIRGFTTDTHERIRAEEVRGNLSDTILKTTQLYSNPQRDSMSYLVLESCWNSFP